MVCTRQHILLGWQNKKKKYVGGACGKMGGEEGRGACLVLVRNLREREGLENLGVEEILKKRVGCGLDWSGSEYGQVVGSCECRNEHSDSIKRGKSLANLYIASFSKILLHEISNSVSRSVDQLFS